MSAAAQQRRTPGRGRAVQVPAEVRDQEGRPPLPDLQPYPAMRNSGVEWLGEVPEHWERRRLKSLLIPSDRRSATGEEALLSLRRDHGIVVYADHFSRPSQAASNVGYKLVAVDQIVVNRLQANNGLIFRSAIAGLVSPDYSVFDVRPAADPEYLACLLRTNRYRSQFRREATGLGTGNAGFLRLYDNKLLETVVFLPSTLPEQAAIVRFLDYADRRTRRYIRAKQKLIGLLEEQKQAIIHRAVTRGLDPNVPLKPSGIDWLGDIPEHWEVSRVKREFHCLNHRRVPLSSTERGAMVLRRYDYYGASGVIDKVDDFLFDDELLLVAEDGANLVLRNLPLAITARGRFWVNNHAHILKPKRGNLEYLAAAMEMLDYRPWVSGAAQPKLTKDRLLSIAIAVPPRAEQDKIIAASADETSALRASVDGATREIGLLREYRTRLIADVVTGKLDVREAAADLPGEPDEPEPPDDVEAEAMDDAEEVADGEG